MSDAPVTLHEVQAMLGRERLGIDVCEQGRTCFISHVGAVPKLLPGAWIGHRDTLRAMALANLHPQQRASLAGAVLVDHGSEFGVGRLQLETLASGLPFGGSSLWLQGRSGGVSCLYTWALAGPARTKTCDWLVVRAQPEWALDHPPRPLSAAGLSTLVELAGSALVVVETVVDARQLADELVDVIPVTAHARFYPYLDACDAEAPVLIWPSDALDSPTLRGREFGTVVSLAGDEASYAVVSRWAEGRERVQTAKASCPGRTDRAGLEQFWRDCGRPKVLLTGDAEWAAQGSAWLRGLGAHVHGQQRATQLGLF
ncbi:MAG: hypothetical protein V3V08_23790 [Nannocystaceae bacterium]